MLSKATADEGFQELRRSGDRTDYESTLAQLAREDNVNEARSLELLLSKEPVLSWLKDDVLRKVRKHRLGRHRFYITGRNTDCEYTVCYIKLHKKEHVDREEDLRFQRKILAALQSKETRELKAPDPPDDDTD